MPPISVAVVGGQKTFAAVLPALSREKDIQVIGRVDTMADIFSKLTEAESTIILIDFSVVSEVHYVMLTDLRRSHPNIRIIFLCDGADQAKLVQAFRCGASGYLEVNDSLVFLAKSVQAVSNGEAWVPRQFVAKIVERLNQNPS